MAEEYLSTSQVVRRLGVSAAAVKERITRGLLVAEKIDGQWRIDSTSVEEWEAERQVRAGGGLVPGTHLPATAGGLAQVASTSGALASPLAEVQAAIREVLSPFIHEIGESQRMAFSQLDQRLTQAAQAQAEAVRRAEDRAEEAEKAAETAQAQAEQALAALENTQDELRRSTDVVGALEQRVAGIEHARRRPWWRLFG